MNILEQLGLNHTYFIQLGVFVFTILVLSQVVFKDFFELHQLREQKTSGAVDIAQEEIQKAQSLSRSYETLARELNGQVKSIFDSYREEAAAEYQNIVARARAESNRIIEDNRQRVSLEIAEASRQLSDQLPALSQAIVQRLISKSGGKAS
jgi:F-type H+-transporting ATPase subunit b